MSVRPRLATCATWSAVLLLSAFASASSEGWIQPYPAVPTYWEYIKPGPQLNNIVPSVEVDQISAFVWVRPETLIGQNVAIIAHTSWRFGSDDRAERQVVCCLTVLRFSGVDGEGLSLERREVIQDRPVTVRPGEIRSLDDCFEDVTRAFSYVTTARFQALTQCESGWGSWKPDWTPWQVVRLPRNATYEFGKAGLESVTLLVKEEESKLIATVSVAGR